MADEDKQKAEKVAAAKKRYEQLKKQKAKEGKKAGTKAEKSAETKTDDVKEADAKESDTKENEASAVADKDEAEDGADTTAAQSTETKTRSDSFKAGGPSGEVQELYKKQNARIEELEKENQTLKQEQADTSTHLTKAEEELESLRDGSSDVAALKLKAKEADSLSTELASVQRQLVQAQQSAKGHARRLTATSTDITQQLASKTSTIETLELEVSKLRNQVTSHESTIKERDESLKDAQEQIAAAEAATKAAKEEVDALRVSISFPSEETKAANEDPEALTKRIAILESDLRTATSNIDATSDRATTLQQKLDALTKLHKDAAAVSQGKDRELNDLRSQLKRRDRSSHVRDASDFDLQDEETETGELHARVRALEAENFDLRRGVWREKRAELADQDGLLEYEDVALGSPRSNSAAPRLAHSTLQDVINSGISAFTGRPVDPSRDASSLANRPRKQSLGLLSEDGFDEEAFLLAQQEEAKRRVERVKDVKRSLPQWKGWRIDLLEIRQHGVGGGREVGPIFQI